jgi:hypothetical protein
MPISLGSELCLGASSYAMLRVVIGQILDRPGTSQSTGQEHLRAMEELEESQLPDRIISVAE